MPKIPPFQNEGAARWIHMGSVRPNFYIHRGNCGFPGGLCFEWRGRLSFGQPCEFLYWSELHAALRRRLQLARLAETAIAMKVPPKKPNPITGRLIEVWVLVRRAAKPNRNRMPLGCGAT